MDTGFASHHSLGNDAGRKVEGALAILPRICATLAVVLGLITFIGWISGLSLLASVRAKYIPMAPSTALCFSLIGVGLLVRQKICAPSRLFALLMLTMAMAKLIEFAGGYRFGIDAWFVRNPGLFGAVPTGRMAPNDRVEFRAHGLR